MQFSNIGKFFTKQSRNKNKIRFFIALEIPERSRKELKVVQEKVRHLIPSAHLTDNDKLHLTIAFIGEQPAELKEPLITIMAEAAKGIPPFEVTPAYLDGFPHLHQARTLWVGVKDDIDKLFHLRHHIKDGLKSLNLIVDERRFVPHIAIAKLNRFEMTPELEQKLDEIMDKEFFPIYIESVKLFESIPDEGFHTHNTLAEITLQG